MNRIVLCGVAIFFAIVGIALVGGEEKASAGLFRHGCGGCDGGCGGVVDCGGDDCCGRKKFRRCGGKQRCGGLFGKKRCCGEEVTCCGEAPVCAEPACAAPVAPSCCGEAPIAPGCAGEIAPPAPAGDVPPPPAPEEKKA